MFGGNFHIIQSGISFKFSILINNYLDTQCTYTYTLTNCDHINLGREAETKMKVKCINVPILMMTVLISGTYGFFTDQCKFLFFIDFLDQYRVY